MELIKKLFQSKSMIKFYVSEFGLNEAIDKYGIEALCKNKFLKQLPGTELFRDFSPWDQRVYNKDGKCLFMMDITTQGYGEIIEYVIGIKKQRDENITLFDNNNHSLSTKELYRAYEPE